MSESNLDVIHVEHQKPSNTPPAMDPKPEKLEKLEKLEKPKAPPSRPLAQARNSSMNGPLYMQTVNNKVSDGPLKNLVRWLLENQTGTL
jgi:acyl-CoA-dependent ceramide synthase